MGSASKILPQTSSELHWDMPWEGFGKAKISQDVHPTARDLVWGQLWGSVSFISMCSMWGCSKLSCFAVYFCTAVLRFLNRGTSNPNTENVPLASGKGKHFRRGHVGLFLPRLLEIFLC